MSAPLLVTAAIIRDGPLILIARRKLDAKVEAGRWEFPGGKVDFGEHPEDCLKREILEELNLDIEIERFFDVASHVYSAAGSVASPKTSGLHVILLCYICRLLGGELKLLDVAEVAWVNLDELAKYQFALADIPLVARLKREAKSNS
jgi:8-oxo-dGTP diphosphatase